LEVYRHLLVWR